MFFQSLSVGRCHLNKGSDDLLELGVSVGDGGMLLGQHGDGLPLEGSPQLSHVQLLILIQSEQQHRPLDLFTHGYLCRTQNNFQMDPICRLEML